MNSYSQLFLLPILQLSMPGLLWEMQDLHIFWSATPTSHSHNSSGGSSLQALEIQREDQEKFTMKQWKCAFLHFCSLEEQRHSPWKRFLDPSLNLVGTHVQNKHSNTVHIFRWSLRTLRVLVYLMNSRCKINLWLYCHRTITLSSYLDTAHNVHNRMLYLLLQLLVQVCFLGCTSHFTETFKQTVLSW